jgi:hypothetical protein
VFSLFNFAEEATGYVNGEEFKKHEKPELYYTEIIKNALPESRVIVLDGIFFFLSDNQNMLY